MMKTVTIPRQAPYRITYPNGAPLMRRGPNGAPEETIVGTDDFVIERALDPVFSNHIENVGIAWRIKQAVEEARASGGDLVLHARDWRALVKAIEKPTNPYNMHVMLHIYPLVQDILQAQPAEES